METKDQPQGNKTIPENPKPSDEVQLNIETVTPETEKDVMPSEDITSEQSKDQVVNPEDSKATQEKEVSKIEQSEDQAEEKTDQSDEKVHPAADELNKEGGNPNNARDQVETINP